MQRNQWSKEQRAAKVAELQAMATATLVLQMEPQATEEWLAARAQVRDLVAELTTAD